MLDLIRNIDYSIFSFFNDLIKESYWIKATVYVIAKYFIFFFFAVMGYMFWFISDKKKGEAHRAKRAVIYTLLSLAWAFLIDQIINLVFVRARPAISHPGDVKQLSVTVDPTSFPSSHTIFVFAIATSFYLSGYKRLGIALYILSAVVGLSRVVAGAHYPIDIFAGVLFGVFSAWLVHREGSWVKKNLLDSLE